MTANLEEIVNKWELFNQAIQYWHNVNLKTMKKHDVAIFIEKLDQILQNTQYSDIICWTQEGDAFIIKSISKLTQHVLPKYFKHHNYSSFNRQLNMYNFVKIRCQTDQIVYRNENFLRYDKEQYRYIKRRSKGEVQQNLKIIPVQEKGIVGELKQLGRRQYRLQNICKSIFDQNQMIISENAKLWKKISQRLDRKDKQLSALLYLLLLQSDNKQLMHTLPLIQNNQHMQQNENSDSSESEDIIDCSRGPNRHLSSLLGNPNVNIQNLMNTYFGGDRINKKDILILPDKSFKAQDPGLCIKENGEGHSNNHSEKEHSIISDVNHFLNRSTDSIKDLSDYGC